MQHKRRTESAYAREIREMNRQGARPVSDRSKQHYERQRTSLLDGWIRWAKRSPPRKPDAIYACGFDPNRKTLRAFVEHAMDCTNPQCRESLKNYQDFKLYIRNKYGKTAEAVA